MQQTIALKLFYTVTVTRTGDSTTWGRITKLNQQPHTCVKVLGKKLRYGCVLQLKV